MNDVPKSGGADGNRTRNLFPTKEVHYRLSYNALPCVLVDREGQAVSHCAGISIMPERVMRRDIESGRIVAPRRARPNSTVRFGLFIEAKDPQ